MLEEERESRSTAGSLPTYSLSTGALYRVIYVLPKAETCRILGKNMQHKIPAVQLLGQKHLESWGYLKPMVFCSFCFSMWQDKSCWQLLNLGLL